MQSEAIRGHQWSERGSLPRTKMRKAIPCNQRQSASISVHQRSERGSLPRTMMRHALRKRASCCTCRSSFARFSGCSRNQRELGQSLSFRVITPPLAT